MTGSNTPKPLTREEVHAWLEDTCGDLTRRAEEILAGISRLLDTYTIIPNEEIQAKVSDFAGTRGAIGAFLTVVEGRRKSEKQPFLDSTRAVDGFFSGLTDKVELGRKQIRERMTAFAVRLEEANREIARKEAEDAAALAAAAEAEAMKTLEPEKLEAASELAKAADKAKERAEAKPAELSRVHGQLGGVSSLRTTWKFDEAGSDLMALAKAVVAGEAPLEYLAFNTTRINVAIRSDGVRKIRGCKIDEIRSV